MKKLFRRAWKPFAMAFVAVTLALSLTVTTTQKAEANPLLLPPLILASGTMPVGTALGLVSLTGPIGWGIVGVGALALGLAATQDYWLPYVTGDLGKSQDSTDEAAEGTYGFQQAAIRNPVLIRNANGEGVYAEMDLVWEGDPPTNLTQDVSIYVILYCTDGTTPSAEWKDSSAMFDRANTKDGSSAHMRFSGCATGAIKGYTAGPPGGHPDLPKSGGVGPRNVVEVGDTRTKPAGSGTGGFDPNSADVRYEATVECVRADGTFFSLTAQSKGSDGAVKMPSCAAAEPGAHGTGKTDVVTYPPGTTMPQPVWSNPRIPASGEYPLCAPERPGPMCSLAVTVDGRPCVDAVGSWNCANWREIANNDSTRVQCSYGPYAGVAVDVCNPMERAYESASGVPATEANLDGNPATRNDSNPQGEPYQKPDGSTKPGGTLAEAPLSGTNPSSNPGEDGQNCLAHGWSWNPVSWVQVPAQCAMQWAFVPPRARLEATVQAIQPKLDSKGIKPFVMPFMENFGAIGGDGCKGPGINLARIGHNATYYPFDACQEPLAPIASGVNTFFSFSIILQGGMSVIRAVAAGFGFNWGAGKDTD